MTPSVEMNSVTTIFPMDTSVCRGVQCLRVGRGAVWNRRVEKRFEHRAQPLVALDQPDVSGAGKYRELRTGHTLDVAEHTAAEESKQVHCVLGADDVGVADDHERRCLDRLHDVLGPTLEPAVQLPAFG